MNDYFFFQSKIANFVKEKIANFSNGNSNLSGYKPEKKKLVT